MFDPRTVKRHLDKILDDGEIPQFRPHTARHYAASLLLAQGVRLKVVSDNLAHTSIRITADIYAAVLPSLTQDAIGLMDRMLTAQK